MGKSIYLSPSTQEKNIGKENYGTEEFRMNQICNVTEKILKEYGLTVYRNKPNMTLKEVVVDSNSKKPTAHFSIHSNADDGKSRGCEIFCHKFGTEGEKLAKSVYSEIEPLTPGRDRGIKQGANFYGAGKNLYELANTNSPAALIEIAFHDNTSDAKWIIDNIELIGKSIAKGILSYFGIQYIKPKPKYESILEVSNLINVKVWIDAIKEAKNPNADRDIAKNPKLKPLVNLDDLIVKIYEMAKK